jgi:integrase
MESLYDPNGDRLYLTASERNAFLEAACHSRRDVRSFCEVLHFSGCRISEALAICSKNVDFENRALIFETLKKRRSGVFREVPVPDRLLDTLGLVHAIRDQKTRRDQSLWAWSRTTAWRHVKAVLRCAKISPGAHCSPKGLRHGYGVAAISAGVPLNMLSKWMGHSKIETTAIYANALGAEQRQIAEKMWLV